MSRCYACCQENCGYSRCTCECHIQVTPPKYRKLDQKTQRALDAEQVLHEFPILIAISRQFRARMAMAHQATFTPSDIAVHNLIINIGTTLRIDGTLWSRELCDAWHHACGVEAH